MSNENLQDMVKTLNSEPKEGPEKQSEVPITNEDLKTDQTKEIYLINFYDWFEKFASSITNISRIRQEVSQTNVKDTMIFKVPKGKGVEEKELISFYNSAARPILNLPPLYVKIFKNDTFEVLHSYDDNLFIKSYGIKTGLIIVYCVNINGIVVPYEKIKIKKNVTFLKLGDYSKYQNEIKQKLQQPVDVEAIQLLYKQSLKCKEVFTTKESALNWFVEREKEVIDINHLLKIDSVLINII